MLFHRRHIEVSTEGIVECPIKTFFIYWSFFLLLFSWFLEFFVIDANLCYSSCKCFLICVVSSLFIKDFKICNTITYFTHQINENLRFNAVLFSSFCFSLRKSFLHQDHHLLSFHPKVLLLTVAKTCHLFFWYEVGIWLVFPLDNLPSPFIKLVALSPSRLPLCHTWSFRLRVWVSFFFSPGVCLFVFSWSRSTHCCHQYGFVISALPGISILFSFSERWLSCSWGCVLLLPHWAWVDAVLHSWVTLGHWRCSSGADR